MGVHLESGSVDIVRNAGAEEGRGQRHGAGVGAAEAHEHDHGLLAEIDLVVHQTLGEHEQIAGIQHLGVENVGGVHQTHRQYTLYHVQHLQEMSMESVNFGQNDKLWCNWKPPHRSIILFENCTQTWVYGLLQIFQRGNSMWAEYE